MNVLRVSALRSLCIVVGLSACGAFSSSAARAEDLYGFLDDHGVAHFASEKLDARYQIFFRDGQSFDTRDGLQAPRAAGARSSPGASGAQKQPSAAAQTLLSLFQAAPSYRPARTALTAAAHLHGIDYALLQAVVATESGFDTHAVSPKGARGLMQLMPATADLYGVRADRRRTQAAKLSDPQLNIAAGARYLADLVARFSGRLELALAAYNAGPGAVDQAGGKVPPYRETQNYVKTVMQLYAYLKPEAPDAPGAGATRQRSGVPARIRMQMGGAIGRGNMPAEGAVILPQLPDAAADEAGAARRPPGAVSASALESASESASVAASALAPIAASAAGSP